MKILILGAGKMGSFFTDLLSFDHEVAVLEKDPKRMRFIYNALRLQNPEEVKDFNPELVINCVTLSYTIEAFKAVMPYLQPYCIISDIASVKTYLKEFYETCGFPYVSTHPMFGPTFANLGQLEKENTIIISEGDHLGKIFFKDIYSSLRLHICEYTFEEHDKVVAYSLGIPFASTMVFAATMKHQDAPGTTFKRHMKIARGLLSEDDYLLTTKLFCGTCGAMMVGESGTSSSKGRKYHYYRCVNTKKHRTCDAKHKTVRKLPLENAVVNAVMAKIMDDNFAEYVADAVMDIQSRESSVLPALRKQMEEAESGITNMLNAIQMGIINASTKQRLDELEERKKDIELQIIQEEMKHPAVSREDVIYFVCRFRSLDTSKLDARRRLIDSFVNAVTIFDDYILITFNYKEGETRIDFTDIESSDLQSVGGATATAAIHTEAKDSDDIIAAINVAFANTVSKLPALPEAYRV